MDVFFQFKLTDKYDKYINGWCQERNKPRFFRSWLLNFFLLANYLAKRYDFEHILIPQNIEIAVRAFLLNPYFLNPKLVEGQKI